MSKTHLILGATGSLGYAYTNELLAQGIETDILVRNRAKAEELFHNNPLLTIHTGDVNNEETLMTLASEADFIFHGINYPYQLWSKYMIPVTSKIIKAAEQNGATILFPGNIYSYGMIDDPIKEETRPEPTTNKGQLRLEIESLLEMASKKGTCRVINLRLPDFWGPNVTNGLIKPLLGNAASGKTMRWMVRADIPHQFAYTPDVARILFQLTQVTDRSPYYLLNYGGQIFPEVSEFASEISRIAGSPNRLKLFSKWVLGFLGIFVPVIRELIENLYQFENSIIIDDSKFHSILPDFIETELDVAITRTIGWYRNNAM